jgi:hypothetical protein
MISQALTPAVADCSLSPLRGGMATTPRGISRWKQLAS